MRIAIIESTRSSGDRASAALSGTGPSSDWRTVSSPFRAAARAFIFSKATIERVITVVFIRCKQPLCGATNCLYFCNMRKRLRGQMTEDAIMKSIPELALYWLKRHPDTLTHGERNVLQSTVERRPVSRDTNEAYEKHLSFGDRLADSIAQIGGSWSFIASFGVFLALWALTNRWLARDAFDPYPFIFLNLLLSMLAAIQAPVIMMSQNRQSEHDRIDASHDYEVNLKSEIQIMALHEKLDQLRNDQLVTILDRIEKLTKDIQRLERGRKQRTAN
jgi:uncharacterized membrane protein